MSEAPPNRARRTALAVAALAVGLVGWWMLDMRASHTPAAAAHPGGEASRAPASPNDPTSAAALDAGQPQALQPSLDDSAQVTVKAQHEQDELVLEAQGAAARAALLQRQIRQLERQLDASDGAGDSERSRLLRKRLDYLRKTDAADRAAAN